MKITTRIASGYALFAAVLAGLVGFQIVTVHRLQETGQTLSEDYFQNAITCVTALGDLESVAEFTGKSLASAAPDYKEQLQDAQESFRKSLSDLTARAPSSDEQMEIRRLSRQWDAYMREFSAFQSGVTQPDAAAPDTLLEHMENLKSQTRTVYHAIMRAMESRVEASRKTGETALRALWWVTFAALAICVLVSLLIIRSVSKPLAQLTEGAREIADGKAFYKLDTSRSDELSQIARDFNRMASRLNEPGEKIRQQHRDSEEPEP